MNKPKTIFCDLDGTLVKHSNPVEVQNPNLELKVLPGTHDRLREWDSKGYYIIITIYILYKITFKLFTFVLQYSIILLIL